MKYRSGLACAHLKNEIKSLDSLKNIYIIVTFCFWVAYICCNNITQGKGYGTKLVLLGTNTPQKSDTPTTDPKI
jgi:hypothetical protein